MGHCKKKFPEASLWVRRQGTKVTCNGQKVPKLLQTYSKLCRCVIKEPDHQSQENGSSSALGLTFPPPMKYWRGREIAWSSSQTWSYGKTTTQYWLFIHTPALCSSCGQHCISNSVWARHMVCSQKYLFSFGWIGSESSVFALKWPMTLQAPEASTGICGPGSSDTALSFQRAEPGRKTWPQIFPLLDKWPLRRLETHTFGFSKVERCMQSLKNIREW